MNSVLLGGLLGLMLAVGVIIAVRACPADAPDSIGRSCGALPR